MPLACCRFETCCRGLRQQTRQPKKSRRTVYVPSAFGGVRGPHQQARGSVIPEGGVRCRAKARDAGEGGDSRLTRYDNEQPRVTALVQPHFRLRFVGAAAGPHLTGPAKRNLRPSSGASTSLPGGSHAMCGPPHRTSRSGLGSGAAAPGSTAPSLLAVDPSAPRGRYESSTSWSPKKRLTGPSQFLHRADSAEPTRLPEIALVAGRVMAPSVKPTTITTGEDPA